MSATAIPVPSGRSLWSRIKSSPLALKLLAGIMLFGLWEICTWAFAAPFVTRPSGVIMKLPAAVMSAELWAASWSTLSAVLIGLAVSLVAGVLIGVAMGRQPWVNRVSELWVNSFYAMPMVAVLPLLTMWFGYSAGARFAIIVFAALFSIILNVADGVRNVPREYLEVARSFRAGPRDIWFGISLFASLPYLIAGIRLAIGRGLVGAVLAEIYASVPGIGFYILSNARALEQDVAMCAVLVLAAFGIGLDAIMGWILRRWFPWYRREGRE